MDNPEYTERMVNEALKARTDLPITISWDGNEPCQDETANFEVYLDWCDTDLVVWDHGSSFDIVERSKPNHYAHVDYATKFDTLAAKLVTLIEEAIAAGKLGVEE